MIKAITWPLAEHRQPLRQTHAGARAQAEGTSGQVQGIAGETADRDLRALQGLWRQPVRRLSPGVHPDARFLQPLLYAAERGRVARPGLLSGCNDLTQPDTVASFTLPFVIPLLNTSHLALHPLPLMVTALTMVMMRLTPQIGDPTQAKVAQFMPLVFLVIFYNFAAALSLYYVINNSVSIIQDLPQPEKADAGVEEKAEEVGEPHAFRR